MTIIFTSKFGAISFERMNNTELSSKTLSKSSLQTLPVWEVYLVFWMLLEFLGPYMLGQLPWSWVNFQRNQYHSDKIIKY